MPASRDEPLDAAAAALNDTDPPVAEPRPRERRPRTALVTSVMLVVVTVSLLGASVACLGVAGLVLAAWLPAVIDALIEGALKERAWRLAGALAAPLVVWALVWLSWRAFGHARTGRSADFMMLALTAALALSWAAFGGLIWGPG